MTEIWSATTSCWLVARVRSTFLPFVCDAPAVHYQTSAVHCAPTINLRVPHRVKDKLQLER